MTNGEDMEFEGAPPITDDRILVDDNGDFAGEELATPEEIEAMTEATKDLPTYVCLVGAPGSGKSELAAAIAGYYDMVIVDNYATDLAKDMDIALGFFASYVPNMMVAFEREKADHKARNGTNSVVVVGSLIESMAYAGLQAEYHAAQITTPEQQMQLAKEMESMKMFGLMITDLLRFHHFFYLPLPPEIEVPGQDPKFSNATRSLDNAIAQIMGQVAVPVHHLTGNLDTKFEAVKDTIGHLATETPSD